MPSEHDSRRRLRQEPIVRGEDHLWETYGGLRLKIGYRSFMQANWDVFQLLGKTIGGMVGEPEEPNDFRVVCGNRPH